MMAQWWHSPRVTVWLAPWACCCGIAVAQDLEPRRWTHLPVDSNVVGITYGFTTGDLNFDPVRRIQNAKVDKQTVILSYVRTFELFDQTARVDVAVPLQSGHWDGLVDGEQREIHRDGLADPVVRLSIDFAGAPALRGEEFQQYRREHATNTIAGVGVGIGLPLGEYMNDKLINLGENRFAIWPQFGMVHRRGPWSFELTGTLFVFTDNDDFFNGNTVDRDPLFAVQAHVTRTFEGGFWVSGGIAYGWGGDSKVNGVRQDDKASNLLFGASCGFPITTTQALQVGYVRGDTLANVGSDTHNVYVGWTIRF